MADISYTVDHTLSHDEALKAAQKVADDLAREYELSCEWDGDVLNFSRSGVKGNLTVTPDQACIEIKLGFLLSAFSGKIEEQVSKNMRKVFCGEA
ncbi:polyhydroxyalkanoic acid system family protein [Massilia sp. W12]|uniref:polyhydroxyalkanoic acid system family protein n=1 Tax=Massilia sp. W12 TaxID=3126507 RepID=UPI0030CB56A3